MSLFFSRPTLWTTHNAFKGFANLYILSIYLLSFVESSPDYEIPQITPNPTQNLISTSLFANRQIATAFALMALYELLLDPVALCLTGRRKTLLGSSVHHAVVAFWSVWILQNLESATCAASLSSHIAVICLTRFTVYTSAALASQYERTSPRRNTKLRFLQTMGASQFVFLFVLTIRDLYSCPWSLILEAEAAFIALLMLLQVSLQICKCSYRLAGVVLVYKTMSSAANDHLPVLVPLEAPCSC